MSPKIVKMVQQLHFQSTVEILFALSEVIRAMFDKICFHLKMCSMTQWLKMAALNAAQNLAHKGEGCLLRQELLCCWLSGFLYNSISKPSPSSTSQAYNPFLQPMFFLSSASQMQQMHIGIAYVRKYFYCTISENAEFCFSYLFLPLINLYLLIETSASKVHL